MKTENLIPVQKICTGYNIEISFIHSLNQYGLVELTTSGETAFIDAGQLKRLEQFVRLHHELEINLEGIETIIHLLDRMTALQDEATALKNRLRLYEP